jgi:hypothetical protein
MRHPEVPRVNQRNEGSRVERQNAELMRARSLRRLNCAEVRDGAFEIRS